MLTRDLPFHVFRLALGFVYFHFGILEVFPDLSPAELLASQTIMRLTSGMLDAHTALYWLAVMECVLGLLLMFNIWIRFTAVWFLFHMLGTFAPLVVLPELTPKVAPLAPTIESQYILKNLVFVASGWAILLPELFQPKGVQSKQAHERAPVTTKQVPTPQGIDASLESTRLSVNRHI